MALCSPNEATDGTVMAADEDDIITVRCSNGDVRWKKQALIKASGYFRALLSGYFMENKESHVNLLYVEKEIVKKVLSLYPRECFDSAPEKFWFLVFSDESDLGLVTNRCPDQDDGITSLEEAWELLQTSDMLGFIKCAKACDQFISSRTNEKNAREFYELANIYGRMQIMRTAVREIILSTYGHKLLNMENFELRKEIRPCEEITSHRNALISSGKSKLNKLANASRELLKRADNKDLYQSNINHHHLPELDDFQEYLCEYKFSRKFYMIGGYAYQPLQSCYSLEANDLLKFLENRENSSDSDCSIKEGKVSLADESDNTDSQRVGISTVAVAEQLSPFPDLKLEDYRVAVIGIDIYVTGGYYYDQLLSSRSTWRYNTREDKWTRQADMKYKRLMHCSAVVGSRIYVCGGYDGEYVHSSTESYDSITNTWIEQPKMCIGVGNAACASLGQSVYVICGQFGSKSIHTTSQVQEFNIERRQWSIFSEYVSPVFYPFSEYGMSCGVIGDELLVVGGQTVRVDCFDTKTKSWRRLADMEKRRIDSYVQTFGGLLLVVGGYDYNEGRFHDTVEVYNSTMNTWSTLHCRLPTHLKNCGFCYVFDVEKR